MDASAIATVLRLASDVKDPRRPNIVHPLPLMIIMVVVAVLFRHTTDAFRDRLHKHHTS